MSEQIKDPLGVVAKWQAEQAGFTGADDLKYGWGFLSLIGVLIACFATLAIWLLGVLF